MVMKIWDGLECKIVNMFPFMVQTDQLTLYLFIYFFVCLFTSVEGISIFVCNTMNSNAFALIYSHSTTT